MLIKSSYPKFGIVIHVGTPRKKHQCIQPICSFTCNENKPMPWQFWISGLEYSHHRYVEDTVPHVWLFFHVLLCTHWYFKSISEYWTTDSTYYLSISPQNFVIWNFRVHADELSIFQKFSSIGNYMYKWCNGSLWCKAKPKHESLNRGSERSYRQH